MKSLTELYKKLNDKPLNEDINRDAQWLLRGELPAGITQDTITKDSHSTLSSYKNLVKHLADNNQEDTIDFPKYGGINFKLLDNEDIEWSLAKKDTTGGETAKEETVEIDIPGVDGKTKVKIEYKDSNQVDKALKGVTITFMYGAEEDVPGVTSNDEGDEVEKYTNVDFKEVEEKENHQNEGQEWIFIAEGDDYMSFEVEVSVDATMEGEGSWEPDFNSIQKIHWDTLRPFMSDEGKSLNEYETEAADDNEDDDIKGQPFPGVGEGICTEQEIREGTCGYGEDGKIGESPAGPHLLNEVTFCNNDNECPAGESCQPNPGGVGDVHFCQSNESQTTTQNIDSKDKIVIRPLDPKKMNAPVNVTKKPMYEEIRRLQKLAGLK